MVQSIVVAELTHLGDVAVVIPPLTALRESHPGARITLFVNNSYAGLVRALLPQVETIGVRSPGRRRGFARAILKARSIRADLAISMSPSRRNALLALSSGALTKVGYLTAEDSRTPYLQTNRVESFGFETLTRAQYARENITERPAKVLEAIGIEYNHRRRVFPLPAETLHSTLARFREEDALPSGRYISIHPFSGWEFRSWKADRFSLLARRLTGQAQIAVVILHGPADRRAMSALQPLLSGVPGVYLFTSEDILDAAAVIAGSVLFIGNDSGPLHLASLLGVESVGLFGPVPPVLTAPPSGRGTMLYRRMECSPCDQLRCIRPSESCMDLITVDEVYDTVTARLGRSARVSGHA